MSQEKTASCADNDPASSSEEQMLITRVLQGDRSAFDVLFLRYQNYVYRIVYGMVGSAEEADDLTQEVFVQAFRALPRFRGQSRFSTWLYRIAVNKATDAMRATGRRRLLSLKNWAISQKSAEFPTQQEVDHQQALQDAVQRALMHCPVPFRQVLVLRYYNECSMEEIAETLACSVEAVKVRLHRARETFRKAYEAVCKEDERELE